MELDALHWQPGWVEADDETFREKVREAVAGDGWVVDGNYAVVRDLVWGRADTVIWLDFSLAVTLRRVVWRTLRRSFTRETCCNGNRESLARAFLSRDSVILWALTTHGRKRREYPGKVDALEAGGVEVVRLRTPREAARWVRDVGRQAGGGEPSDRVAIRELGGGDGGDPERGLHE